MTTSWYPSYRYPCRYCRGRFEVDRGGYDPAQGSIAEYSEAALRRHLAQAHSSARLLWSLLWSSIRRRTP